ncbi:hypothetical protein NX784_09535 [Massilia pinisoli]|uniref:Uncharacterized protein n=1 Tax=Massilia pinisoli TaxID=1772194 RepID=A0ABT1ZPI3_9BURK|nr:hypothetical protein [Massilia pinisoli]MCS0581833.1 hypothetical protein [Massilia pinisoli]
MDANQRSEANNQTNNGANEKWTPGSEGASADHGQPLDHTYPRGLGVQQGNQQRDMMGTQQSGAGAHPTGDDAGIPGGSMDTQINGGSGAVQGITDSHQRQMEQKSGAYGLLEQAVGHRPKDSGVDLVHERDMHRDVVRGNMASQNPAQPDLQGGSLSDSRGNLQGSAQTYGGGMHGPRSELPSQPPGGSMGNRQSGASSTQGGGMPGPGAAGGREAQRGNTQLEVTGSRSMSNQNSDVGGVHQSNDVAGGLPRSPGNTGADSTDRQGSQTGSTASAGGPSVHKSNDAAGGYPRSPGFANKLHGDDNMDDDTGFKSKP